MMILTILGSLLIYVINASVLSVSCSFDSCPSMCSGQACILYYIQDVGYTLNKCTDTCDGITSDNFSLQKCSNVKDVSNTKTCQNQCCYYHSL